MNFVLKSVAVAALSLTLSSAFAQKGETVKIALIDPQTGLMGPLGLNQMRSWQFFAEEFTKNNPARTEAPRSPFRPVLTQRRSRSFSPDSRQQLVRQVVPPETP